MSLAPSRSTGTQWNLYISSNAVGTAEITWPVTTTKRTLNLTAGGIQEVNVAEVDRIAIGASGVQAKNIKKNHAPPS